MRSRKLLAYLLIALTFFIAACGNATTDIQQEPARVQAEETVTENQILDQTTPSEPNEPENTAAAEIPKPEGILKVHFLDVGQADCILIQAPTGENMLIDAGNNEDANTIVSYLNAQDVKKIDVLVGTHPHEDHIGSLDTVINTYDIGKIYMPKTTTTTKTFEDVLTSIENKGLKITTAAGGKIIDFSSNTKVEILAPNSSEYDDLNNYSAVIKLTYGNTAFLFTGDAENISENEILAGNYDLKADILKVGHHGSDSSTTKSFLTAVMPEFAVICVGKGNEYGHPHKEILNRLFEAGIKVYRTDESGNIIFSTDGEKFEVETFNSMNNHTQKNTDEPEEINEPSQPTKEEVTVYITKTGEKYHNDGCSSLRKSKIPVTLTEAKSRGYEPCKLCKPPQ